jgi:acyl-CoA thioesterase-1
MESDMDRIGTNGSRRSWLAHCSLLVAGLGCSVVRAAADTQPANRKILVVGDSRSAEYGLARGTGWVALLEDRLQREKLPATVINAASAATSSRGNANARCLRYKPTRHLEPGGKCVRGLPLAMTRDNLVAMTQAAQAGGARVLLVGMQVPPNYGVYAGVRGDFARWRRGARWCCSATGVADGPRPSPVPTRPDPPQRGQHRSSVNVHASRQRARLQCGLAPPTMSGLVHLRGLS